MSPTSATRGRTRTRPATRTIPGLFAIRCRPANEPAVIEALAPFGRIERLKQHHLLLLKAPASKLIAARRKLKQLHRDGLCEFFTSVLEDRDTQLHRILTDEITVRFKPEVSVRRRESLQRKLGIRSLRRNEFVPNQCVVQVHKPTLLQTLKVAKTLDSADEVEFATPNFISQHRR
jgi:hypothetical protein